MCHLERSKRSCLVGLKINLTIVEVLVHLKRLILESFSFWGGIFRYAQDDLIFHF
jgi:hypothetical protein